MSDWRIRTEMLLGEKGIERLQQAKVAVFGVGGVGSYVAEALARAGIGHLVLIDGDVVADSNRNRQLVALSSTVGQSKAEVMAQRIRDINPQCHVTPHTLFYLPPVGVGLIDGCDYVADAIDMVTAKLGLIEECYQKQIPIISAMGCGNKLDPTQFRVADIYKTSICPLCRVMRRELKKRQIPHLQVVYSEEPTMSPINCGEETERRGLPGSLSFVPGAAGLAMAGKIVRSIAQI